MAVAGRHITPMVVDPHGLAEKFLDEWHNEKDYVIAHTSGSTGKPKEIRLLKSDMLLSARATCRFFGINPKSVLLLPLSTDYIAGKMMIVRAIESGATLYIEKPARAISLDRCGSIDLLPIVPAQLEHILSADKRSIVRNLLIGGGALSPEQETAIAKSGINAWLSYGMTETCSHVAIRKISSEATSFEALPGITFDTDKRGCLVINAPGFSFGRLVTNDIVETESPLRFRWLGRYDNVINSGGIKIHPEEVERKLSSLIKRPFYVIGRQSREWGQEAVMYIEGSGGQEDADAIINEARRILDRYSVPKAVYFIPEFDRTSSDKIIRRLF